LPKCQLCTHLGTRCTYPRFFIKPGPKRNSRNIDGQRRTDGMTTKERFSLHDSSSPVRLVSTTSPGVVRGGDRDNSNRYDGQMATSSSSHLSTTFDRLAMIGIEPPPDSNILPLANVANDKEFGRSNNLFTPMQSPAQPCRSNHPLPPIELINHLVDVFFVAVQPQFRLLHRPSLSRQLQDPPYISNDGSILLLYAIFAVSARYSDDVQVELFDMSLMQASDRKAYVNNT
jgi:hypothetical protein